MVNRLPLATVIILLLGGCSCAYTQKLADGVSNSSVYFEAVRNPFVGGSKLITPGIVITHPDNGETLYDTRVELEYIPLGSVVNCSYRLNGGWWYEIPDCTSPYNVTVALGANTIEVRGWDSGGRGGSDFVRFWVSGYGGAEISWWMFYVIVGVLFLLFMFDSQEQQEKQQL